MSLLYAYVARDTAILAEHATSEGNFAQVAMHCWTNLKDSTSRVTIVGDKHLLHFLSEDDIIYLVVSDASCPREIGFYFLDKVRKRSCD